MSPEEAARRLFESLVPEALRPRLREAKRVFVAAHRRLHGLPFELLVVGEEQGQPMRWIDGWPPIAYVPSGSALWWLRNRDTKPRASETELDLLAIGDPAMPGSPGAEDVKQSPRLEAETPLPIDLQIEQMRRHGEVERVRQLPRLTGARAEAQSIVRAWDAAGSKAVTLLGADATEQAVFDLAAKTKYLHFACHGIAEEYAGQSLSMLVLSQPERVLPQDDGLLKLADLLNAWRGRLSPCRLVVLSACRTNVGPTGLDDSPQALPIGFLFAGARGVISSLWAVDDASTRDLMADFYRRLIDGETDVLAAFTAAKRALRTKYPDPFHWAPFLYVGSAD